MFKLFRLFVLDVRFIFQEFLIIFLYTNEAIYLNLFENFRNGPSFAESENYITLVKEFVKCTCNLWSTHHDLHSSKICNEYCQHNILKICYSYIHIIKHIWSPLKFARFCKISGNVILFLKL